MPLIPPELIRATVMIKDPRETCVGTGFGYARPKEYNRVDPSVHSTPSDDNPWYLWYITCAHLIDAIEASQIGSSASVQVELNYISPEEDKKIFRDPIAYSWTRHKGWADRCSRLGPIAHRNYELEDAAVDVAVTKADTRQEGFDDLDWWGFPPCFHVDNNMQDVTEGDEVLVMGFPIGGVYKTQKNWPVVRQGGVAQIQPYLRGDTQIFLIDGSIFSGNSGGPVVTKPQPMTTRNTNTLIGMVSGMQKSPLIEHVAENADLGMVVPLNVINDTIDMAIDMET